ncbi:hypothetical protein [Streptomyces sp. NPDC088766]|uniref:hypothetical protein n=1 Tax=Streptomyces sp. NPDC088766 TaxID=3365893 RepID=UPI00382D15D4
MAQDTVRQAPPSRASSARALLPSVLPALIVGAPASLLLLLVTGRRQMQLREDGRTTG